MRGAHIHFQLNHIMNKRVFDDGLHYSDESCRFRGCGGGVWEFHAGVNLICVGMIAIAKLVLTQKKSPYVNVVVAVCC